MRRNPHCTLSPNIKGNFFGCVGSAQHTSLFCILSYLCIRVSPWMDVSSHPSIQNKFYSHVHRPPPLGFSLIRCALLRILFPPLPTD
ncbi:hypothetical protein J6590_028426 [Homalodisca vitripennis]|nr:hypothetical protein J6590_028426 [Homalodisca vitripennis]